MTHWVDQLKESIPEYAKDIKLNLDAVINRSEIDPDYALHIAIASAFATGNSKLLAFLVGNSTNEIERDAALGAGAIMAQNLVVEIETDFSIDANLVANLNQAADGKLEFTAHSEQKLKMVSSGSSFFPIAVKANRIDFDKGVFKGLALVTDNRNFF